MYIPPKYRMADEVDCFEVIRKNPFGIVAINHHGSPVASHLPFELWEEKRQLFAHISKANLLHHAIEEQQEALVIFQGPHAYISPSWYEKENVPTWNYIAVHIYGKLKIIDQHHHRQPMANLMNDYEKHQTNGRTFESLSERLVAADLAGIVAFTIDIERIEGAKKLSQNRNENDYQNIIHQLKKGSEQERMVGEEMERLLQKRIEQRSGL